MGALSCDVREAECTCAEDAGHDGPHVCACGGSWLEVAGTFEVYAAPGSDPDWRGPDTTAMWLGLLE